MSSLTTEPRTTPDDADLLEQVATGDQVALSTLYDRYAGMLLGLARRVLHSTEDAEEVLQEAFVQVWQQAPRYDRKKSAVSTWLVLLTRSRAIDRLRSRQVKDRTLTNLQQEKRSSHTSPEGSSNVLHQQRRQRLRRELTLLPAEQRQVLELAFFAGMTQSEIANDTGIPLGTVKTRTLLAMKKLRQALQGDLRDLL
ncbi:MAG: sigma-70 family RNA polymerase sigma factor [Acidobacteriota bacterium]